MERSILSPFYQVIIRDISWTGGIGQSVRVVLSIIGPSFIKNQRCSPIRKTLILGLSITFGYLINCDVRWSFREVWKEGPASLIKCWIVLIPISVPQVHLKGASCTSYHSSYFLHENLYRVRENLWNWITSRLSGIESMSRYEIWLSNYIVK